jgi:hypothetical protein
MYYIYLTLVWSEKDVRLAQKMQVGHNAFPWEHS